MAKTHTRRLDSPWKIDRAATCPVANRRLPSMGRRFDPSIFRHSMNGPLLSVVTVIYAGVAVGYALDGRWGMCLAFVAYALANIGFVLDLK